MSADTPIIEEPIVVPDKVDSKSVGGSSSLTQPPGSEEPDITKEKVQDVVEDDWETSLDNARNWPSKKKWLMVSIVSCRAYIHVTPPQVW